MTPHGIFLPVFCGTGPPSPIMSSTGTSTIFTPVLYFIRIRRLFTSSAFLISKFWYQLCFFS